MASIYNIEKNVESIQLQLKVICEMLGIDPMPMPLDDNYDPKVAQQVAEALNNPDA